MKRETEEHVRALALNGMTAKEIAERTGCSLEGVRRVIEGGGLGEEAQARKLAKLAKGASWDNQLDDLADSALSWLTRVLNGEEEAPNSVKLSACKLVLEHRPDQHFAKGSKVQTKSDKQVTHVVDGSSLEHLRRLAAPASIPVEGKVVEFSLPHMAGGI